VCWNYREEVFEGNVSRIRNKQLVTCYFRTDNAQLDLPPVAVCSKDKLTLHVNSTITYKISNLPNAIYEMDDMLSYLQQVVFQAIRFVASNKVADDLHGKDYTLAAEIMHHISQTLAGFGAECTQVMIQSIDLDPSIEKANTEIFAELRKFELQKKKLQSEHETALRALEMKSLIQAQELEIEKQKSKQLIEKAQTEATCKKIRWLAMEEVGLTADHIVALENAERFLSAVPRSSVVYLPANAFWSSTVGASSPIAVPPVQAPGVTPFPVYSTSHSTGEMESVD